jgi:hypothetical protein
MAHVVQPNAVPVKKQVMQAATACMWAICTWAIGKWAIINDMVLLLSVSKRTDLGGMLDMELLHSAAEGSNTLA